MQFPWIRYLWRTRSSSQGQGGASLQALLLASLAWGQEGASCALSTPGACPPPQVTGLPGLQPPQQGAALQPQTVPGVQAGRCGQMRASQHGAF